MTTMLLILFLSAYANAAKPEAAKQPGQIEKKELRISNDGKAIVDQNGREVARFVEDIQMNQPGKVSQKLQGCMCCTPECILYDRNGVFIKKYSSCTWDFDCSCR
jgi:hypothetical protein